MALVHVTDVKIFNNPTKFTDNFQFQITFNSVTSLPYDVEWSLIYVGSADDKSKDQVLESVEVGPISNGTSTFMLEAPAPDMNRIPRDEMFGITILLLKGTYRQQEFVRIGYYLRVDYRDDEYIKFVEEWEEKHRTRMDEEDIGEEDEEDDEEADADEEMDDGEEEAEADDEMACDDDKASKSDESTTASAQHQSEQGREDKSTPTESATTKKEPPTHPLLNPRNWPNFDINKVYRVLMDIPPRVTYFTIAWE